MSLIRLTHSVQALRPVALLVLALGLAGLATGCEITEDDAPPPPPPASQTETTLTGGSSRTWTVTVVDGTAVGPNDCEGDNTHTFEQASTAYQLDNGSVNCSAEPNNVNGSWELLNQDSFLDIRDGNGNLVQNYELLGVTETAVQVSYLNTNGDTVTETWSR